MATRKAYRTECVYKEVVKLERRGKQGGDSVTKRYHRNVAIVHLRGVSVFADDYRLG